MSKRDEYVESLKKQIDHWNAVTARWEVEAAGARADLKKGCEEQLKLVRAQREKALYQLRLIQDASASAWADLIEGTDGAARELKEAITKASKHFAKQP